MDIYFFPKDLNGFFNSSINCDSSDFLISFNSKIGCKFGINVILVLFGLLES